MRRSKRWMVLIAVVGAALAGWVNRPATTLTLTAHGGFIYVPTGSGVEIGFMKSVNLQDGEMNHDPNVCSVKQLGVELRIDDGRIVSPPNMTSTVIDVTNRTITFDGMASSAVAVEGGWSKPATMPTPARPANRADEAGWKDVYWVPSVTDRATTRLAANWRSYLSGRVVLRGGELRGGIPSEGAAVNGTFDFRSANGAKGPSQAITDRTNYSTPIRGSRVVMHLDTQTYVIEPIDSRKTVGLILTGRHAPADHPVQDGDRMTDFCAFYELLQNPPLMADRLIPQFVPSPTAKGGNGGKPSPGLFCSGGSGEP